MACCSAGDIIGDAQLEWDSSQDDRTLMPLTEIFDFIIENFLGTVCGGQSEKNILILYRRVH